jgi:hypothetical protein
LISRKERKARQRYDGQDDRRDRLNAKMKVIYKGEYVKLACQQCGGELPLYPICLDFLPYCSEKCAATHTPPAHTHAGRR